MLSISQKSRHHASPVDSVAIQRLVEDISLLHSGTKPRNPRHSRCYTITGRQSATLTQPQSQKPATVPLSRYENLQAQLSALKRQLAAKDQEIERLQAIIVESFGQPFKAAEVLRCSQLAERDLQAQAQLEAKLIEQKLELRSKYTQQMQKLKTQLDMSGSKQFEDVSQSGDKSVQTAVFGRPATKLNTEHNGQFAVEKETIDFSTLSECQRCRAFSSLHKGLNQQIAQVNVSFEATQLK